MTAIFLNPNLSIILNPLTRIKRKADRDPGN